MPRKKKEEKKMSMDDYWAMTENGGVMPEKPQRRDLRRKRRGKKHEGHGPDKIKNTYFAEVTFGHVWAGVG